MNAPSAQGTPLPERAFHPDLDRPGFEALAQPGDFKFWWASDIARLLGYPDLDAFRKAINKAMIACDALGVPLVENFVQERRVVDGREQLDFRLSRFACYLAAMNGNVNNPRVAQAQAYFVTFAEACRLYLERAENVERVGLRAELSDRERSLSGVAQDAGVRDFALFQNAGYRGLYNMDLARLRLLKGVPDVAHAAGFHGQGGTGGQSVPHHADRGEDSQRTATRPAVLGTRRRGGGPPGAPDDAGDQRQPTRGAVARDGHSDRAQAAQVRATGIPEAGPGDRTTPLSRRRRPPNAARISPLMSDTRTQVRLRPVIRVFVSSTFSDMKHERNALEADAFPKLEQLCQRHGFQFQAIDLRWGVSTEAGLDHRTMRICFDELRRAQEISPRPNFLILLGNRYGWRPLPEEISVEEFHTLEHAAAQIPGSADKSAVAVLREWYREDTNAVPPVYLLQSRRQDLGDDQDYTDDAVWNQVQAVLWTIINRAMPPEQLQRRFDGAASDGSPPAIVRFQASATEQEIWHGALRVPDAREHVLAFFREIENLAAFSDPKQIKDFVDVDPSGRVEVALQTEQDRLKAELRQRLGSANVFRNEAPVRLVEAQDNQGGRTADVTTDHLAQLCADVVSRLSEIIQGQIEEYWRNTAQASTDRAARELEIEQREYERFAKERGGEESFVGRQVELQAILDYVGSDSRWPLVIHGASGCGKTALLARASQEVAKTRKRIERFIGVAPRSSDLRSLLSSLCQELRQRNPRADALPTEIKELRDEFSQHLQAATPEQPLILFLDALDQLADADNGRLLNWLPPGSLPAHVKLVVSCLSDRATGDPAGQPYAELKRRQIPAENFINLDVLSEAEARLLLFDRWLPKAGRKVSDDQRARIEQRLASPACRQPIFLKLLFEEVQLWHSYDPAPVPGESVPALLGQLFDRLEPADEPRSAVGESRAGLSVRIPARIGGKRDSGDPVRRPRVQSQAQRSHRTDPA